MTPVPLDPSSIRKGGRAASVSSPQPCSALAPPCPHRGPQKARQRMWGWRGPPASCPPPQHMLPTSPLPLNMLQATGRSGVQREHGQGEQDIWGLLPAMALCFCLLQGTLTSTDQKQRQKHRVLEYLASYRAMGRTPQPSAGPPAPGRAHTKTFALPFHAVNASCVYTGHVEL